MHRADDSDQDAEQHARDWLTICQSELACVEADREAIEAWHAVCAVWAGAAAQIMHQQSENGGFDATGYASAAAPPGTAPTPHAPDARDAEIERLRRRIAELEAERRPGAGKGPGASAA